MRLDGLRRTAVVIMTVATVGAAARATIIAGMDEAALVRSSVAAVRGTVLTVQSAGGKAGAPIRTYITIRPREVVFGDLPAGDVTVRERGGEAANQGEVVFGNPKYRRGEDVLVFLQTDADGTLHTTALAMGKFTIRTGADGKLEAAREVDEEVVDLNLDGSPAASASEDVELDVLLANLRSLAAQRGGGGGAEVLMQPRELAGLQTSVRESFNVFDPAARWFAPDSNNPVTYYVNPDGDSALTAAAGSTATATAVANAFNAWTNEPLASITLVAGGGCPSLQSCGTGIDKINSRCPGSNWIDFDDPCDGIAAPSGCAGVVGMGGYSYNTSTSRVLGGKTYNNIVRGWVVLANGFTGCPGWDTCNVSKFLTHEVGHSIGFAHSADANAIMFASAMFNTRCAELGSDDILGIDTIYPFSGPSSTPTISPTPTATPPPTSTSTITLTATITSTRTPTRTATQTSTASATRTPSQTQTITATPTITNTPPATSTPTETATRTSTGSPTSSATATSTRTSTVTLTSTATATASRTPTSTSTRTNTATISPTATATTPPSPTSTRTPTRTPSATQSATPTRTPSATPQIHAVAGAITYYVGARPVPSATVRASGASSATAISDAGGAYSIGSIGSGALALTPERTGGANGAVSALDASYVLQASVGQRSFSTLQNLAADVSGDGAVTALDASRIAQLVVGKIARLPVASTCNSDWAFVPNPDPAASPTPIQPLMSAGSCVKGAIGYSSLTANATGQSFTGVLFGDPTGNWDSSAGALTVRSSGRARLGRLRRTSPATVSVPIYVTASAALQALELEITHDPRLLRKPTLRTAKQSKDALLVWKRVSGGRVRVVLAGAAPMLTNHGAVAYLDFHVTEWSPSLARSINLLAARIDE